MEFEYEPCRCIKKMDWEEKEKGLVNMIKTKISVEENIKKIVIVSNLESSRICFNNVAISINQGVTFLCICNLRNLEYKVEITLMSDFLSKLVPMSCQIPNASAYVIIPQEHKQECNNQTVPSLKTLSFHSLYLRGCSNRSFSDLTLIGGLPKAIFNERPQMIGQMFYCTVANLIHMNPPFHMPYIPTCANPHLHLYCHVGCYYPM
jgi:hypothetical protein